MTNAPKKNFFLKGGRQEKNQVWPQKYKGYACGPKSYGCMFPGSQCHTQTETNGNIHRHMCLGYLDMSNNSFISSLSLLALPSIRYKMSNTSWLTCWPFWNELFGASYNISPKVEKEEKIFFEVLAMEMSKNKFWVSKLYGCMFPGSPCHTQTETDGNTPCFTNYSFVFQNASLINHSGMYKLNGKIITIIHSEYLKW